MVQRQAQIDEVRLSRLQADLASAQSRSVLIFTVFTVIFLPLTFFTGLFGMNTKEWGGSDFMDIKKIGYITIPASFCIITIALILALSSRIRKLLKAIKKIALKRRKMKGKSVSGGDETETGIGKWWKKKGHKKMKTKRTDTLYEDDYEDFWEVNRRRRRADYRIPHHNRRPIAADEKRTKKN